MRKIAIITSETPNSLHAGSMQLLRVFRDYPAAKLMVLGPQPPAGAKTLGCVYRTLCFPIMRWRKTRFHRQAMSLVLLHRWFRRSPRAVGKLLGDFAPDAVFTVMDNFSHYFTASEYARSAGLPLITITMDEPDSFERILPSLRVRQRAKIAEVYRSAERNLCVSRQMTTHIASTYGCTTETFYFGPPDGVTPRAAAESYALRREGQLVLGFAGSLSYGYGETLERICANLQGTQIMVRIYSRNAPKWRSANMEYAGCLPSEELWATFKRECDASLLVYAFDYHESRLYRTHFPTKLSEYAWLGMPMVMVGPDYATGITWGLENSGCAMVYDKADHRSLSQWLEALATSPDLRYAMADSAAAVAQSQFDPTAIRRNFTRLLQGPEAMRYKASSGEISISLKARQK